MKKLKHEKVIKKREATKRNWTKVEYGT